MKIAIAASGSRGDVQPYVALGGGLKQAGFDVRLLTTDDFEGLVTGAGLEFVSLGTSIEALLQNDEWRAVTESGNFLKILARMNAEMKRRAETIASHTGALFEGTDLLVSGMSGMGGAFSIAEKLRIPVVQAYIFPITPTRAFPSPLTPSLPLGTVTNPPSFHVMRQMLWLSTRAGDAATRRKLGMSRAPIFGPFASLWRRGAPILYGYSRHVLPRPADWDASIHITGYWFLDTPAEWQPPADLVDFLNAGEPPVYIGFGSMGSRDPEKLTAIALDALKRSGQRGVLASGWGGLRQTDLPDSVYMLKSAPHSWLFPRMAALVHHGGAGTTAAGLNAGVPTVIVPFFGDQTFWGRQIARLGVGPDFIPRRRLNADRLAGAITQAVTDQAVRRRAADLAAQIQAEDGIGQAVRQIESIAGRERIRA
jgi:sterol 3beta-glucosyltransferase